VLIWSSLFSVQGVAFETSAGSIVSKAMIKYIAGLPSESVVDVVGKKSPRQNNLSKRQRKNW
jgi:hypothetical protein